MKPAIERRKPEGIKDYTSLALTTFGVGYFPLAPGTWGSIVGIAIFLGVEWVAAATIPNDLLVWPQLLRPQLWAIVATLFLVFVSVGIWAAGRATTLLGSADPPEAVVDEIIGQLVVFLFVPFFIGWPIIVAGFLLFRLFDIWKPYPIDLLQQLPGGLGVCADDILAGVYAGVCLAVIYAASLSV